MEGWGLTTVEANACGTPAIASDVPGLRDSIRSPYTGLLVPYGKDKVFAESILRLIKNGPLRRSLSLESVRWASSFTWEKSALELYIILYQKIRESKEKVVEKSRFSYFVGRITSLF
jgi:glycosyltransferase involved in cell wall biosynthesis